MRQRMEEAENESIGFDMTFEIECAMYEALKRTISKSIDEELEKDSTTTLILAKETMLKNILLRNLDGLEEQQYLTFGPEGKIYLCGNWLMRSLLGNDMRPISTIDYLKQSVDCSNIIFFPNKSGTMLRKELWFAKNEDYPSYNLPKDCRVETPFEKSPVISPPFMQKGPPPGIQGFPPQAGQPPMEMGRPPVQTESPDKKEDLLPPESLLEQVKNEIRITLEETISHTIDKNAEESGLPIPDQKEGMIQAITARNIAEMEKFQYIFLAKDGTIYVCGDWLLRQVHFGESTVPMIARLKQKFYRYTNIEYRPDTAGIALSSDLC